MAVPRFIAGWVADDDQSAVTLRIPVRLEDFPSVGSEHGCPRRACNVEPAVAARREPVDRAEELRDFAARGPDAVELAYHEGPHGWPGAGHLLARVGARGRGQVGDQVRVDAWIIRERALHAGR